MFNHDNINFTKIPPLHCDIIDDVTLLPMCGDIIGKASFYALGAFANKNPLPQTRRMINEVRKCYQLPFIKPWNISTQEVIYGGIFFMHWGHFLLENLQRLWYTKECNLPIVWVGVNGSTHTPAQFKPWQSEIFKALDIKNEHIFLNEPTQFAKVHFPEPASGINTHLHPEHANFLGFYENKPLNGKYVYFSRSKIRGCANEEQLEDILKKRGWHIVYPETLSVTQQLKAISTAEICLMIGGSAQHSILLTKNLQTRFIIIPREHGPTFNIIANAKSDNYYLLNLEKKVLYSDNRDEANDLFTLDIETLKHALDETKDFTANLDNFEYILTKPEKTKASQLKVPSIYYKKPETVTKERSLFFNAYFLYQQKKYDEAYKIFMQLQKDKLLADYMHIDYFNAVQKYHLENGLGITLPLEKYAYDIQALQDEISKNPQTLSLYKKITQLYLIAGDFKNPFNLQLNLLELNPSWSKPLAQMAHIQSLQNNITAAIEYAQKALELEPHKLKRRIELTNFLLKNKEYARAKKIITDGFKNAPTWVEGYVQLGTIHQAQGELDRAIEIINKALQINPDNLTALEKLSSLMQQKGHTAKSSELLAKAMQKNPRLAERYAQNARVYEIKGDLPSAIKYAQMAVDMEPRNFVCKTHLANYLRKNKNYDDVIKLMNDAMHKNPFWSEPQAQFASIFFANGQIDKAIDAARKAVAVEPYDSLRKRELENYRLEKIKSLASDEHEFVAKLNHRHSPARARIQSYIDICYAQTYLEIGVFQGRTFLEIDVPFKVAVDPQFRFDTKQYENENTIFYSSTSDEFFEKFADDSLKLTDKYHNKDFKFDIIFIDGLHTYEQTLKDFENSIAYSHEKTIWIFDDTVPSNSFSAMKSQEESDNLKKVASLSGEKAWHGDVFKAIFAIHDKYPEFSYCTQIDNFNPQTILWRTAKPSNRKKVFNNKTHLARMRYEDFIEYAWIMYPVSDQDVQRKIFQNINPLEYKTGEEYKKVIRPYISDKERDFFEKIKQLEEEIIKLKHEKLEAEKETSKVKAELVNALRNK